MDRLKAEAEEKVKQDKAKQKMLYVNKAFCLLDTSAIHDDMSLRLDNINLDTRKIPIQCLMQSERAKESQAPISAKASEAVRGVGRVMAVGTRGRGM